MCELGAGLRSEHPVGLDIHKHRLITSSGPLKVQFQPKNTEARKAGGAGGRWVKSGGHDLGVSYTRIPCRVQCRSLFKAIPHLHVSLNDNNRVRLENVISVLQMGKPSHGTKWPSQDHTSGTEV